MHLLFGPQGFGWHGLRSISTRVNKWLEVHLAQGSKYLLSATILHCRNGSPVKPDRQIQEGRWLITWHSALEPHVPGHGSTHLFLTQALFGGQSELSEHSGRHPS